MADEKSGEQSLAADALALFVKSQEQAVQVATDTLRKIRSMALTGVSAPDELLKQVAELSGAVTGLAGSATGVAGAVAQPLQDFIVQQRQLVETIARFASAQAELSLVVAEFAQRQAATVAALEKVTSPVLGLLGTREDAS
ncbi:hypothetical protein HH308_15870 [Gordonia sp. TBRC 11910]|uniref:Uncharacterized protein n=1 Tax=Gordonia asplenii TaxID=2725283 RepID=A0A848KVU3_9ACTN|nr:hypothetical protein [Gordonia asplenii]NMO02690.1 hypothetical protein [Gordonia asplenii]